MKRLIVNADDFGWSSRRNAGILEAHRRGIVTSASILAQAPGVREAVEMAKSAPELDLGLHLNLSEGAPLATGHRTLVRRDGRFFGKAETRRRAAEGRFDPEEVAAETEAQIEALQQAGLTISHIDGHHHLHVYGELAGPVSRAAARRGLRWFRAPADALVPPGFDDLSRIEEYRRAAHRSLPAFTDAGLRCAEHFAGAALSGRLDIEVLLAALQTLPDGLTELMVHPGQAGPEGGFDGPARERELAALTDPRARRRLEALGIELTSFGKTT